MNYKKIGEKWGERCGDALSLHLKFVVVLYNNSVETN